MLLDSNIIIYASKEENSHLDSFLQHGDFCVSVISRIEVLGYHKLSVREVLWLESLFDSLSCLPLDEPVAGLAILLRQKQKISLADAIIAATALHHNLPLVTRNIADFQSIPNLQLIDPFKQ